MTKTELIMPAGATSWTWAVRLLERWREEEERVDWLLEKLPRELPPAERARVQALLVGTIRHLGRIDAHLDKLMTRPPRPVVWAGLAVAGFELLEGGTEGHSARVGHHLVEKIKSLASAKEAGFANAVVRRLAERLAAETAPTADAPIEDIVTYHSHPEWLVQRWRMRIGHESALKLVEWNQSPAPVLLRWRATDEGAPKPEWLTPVDGTADFYAAASGHWPELAELIKAGTVQVQDAATRLAVDLLAPQPGETVLDLCAAPGGKSLAMADRMGTGTLVAMDLMGRRMPRLAENLQRVPSGVTATAVAGDLLRGGARALTAKQLPSTYAAVLIDVPCSNTGVMRHRVDVKWRLHPDSFKRHALQQLDLLLAAAERVAPGGRLVYSTCSIDPEENEQIADAFVRRSRGAFSLVRSELSLPWETGHDGAAAFLFQRDASS
ncbi:RsmB/NOP family class I SAM-dependent RNA methyltransferase [Synoicihabitans lomoniglobus]|uniref:SAM-dependent methyltransferase n=1 Tax=Synoicihabitans lomoniglobus TaxID=2909285 RepID=A0AAF0CQW8_9BACT|nr:RNA methyltransferase [Opitutaceae bacterium LMO-M01]WED66407.1 SAM-dependent methyltransferase [Opitutaceae bacterium LMO-M01]